MPQTWGSWTVNNYCIEDPDRILGCTSPYAFPNTGQQFTHLGTGPAATAISTDGGIYIVRSNYGSINEAPITRITGNTHQYVANIMWDNQNSTNKSGYDGYALDTSGNIYQIKVDTTKNPMQTTETKITPTATGVGKFTQLSEMSASDTNHYWVAVDDKGQAWASFSDHTGKVPSRVADNVPNIQKIYDRYAAIDNNNDLWLWYNNSNTFVKVGSNIKDVVTGFFSANGGSNLVYAIALSNDGNLYLIGANGTQKLALQGPFKAISSRALGGYSNIGVIALSEDGRTLTTIGTYTSADGSGTTTAFGAQVASTIKMSSPVSEVWSNSTNGLTAGTLLYEGKQQNGTYVAQTPQTGDPAASIRQTLTYVLGILLIGTAILLTASHRRTMAK